jgi:hypothetical protein
MGDFEIDPNPPNSNANGQNNGGQQTRRDWVQANFTQIFGTPAQDLHAQGIDPHIYAREHRDKIRQFAQAQRRQGISVPSGRNPGNPGSGDGNSAGSVPQPQEYGSRGYGSREYGSRGYGYGMGRFPMGMRWRSAWIGVLVALLALRFLLVDSFAGPHVAVFWVLGIGGIMLVARVFLFSWLRRRRFNRRQSGRNGQSQF